MVYHRHIARLEFLDVPLAVLAVHGKKKLRGLQLLNMLYRYVKLGHHQLHVALADRIPAAVHEPHILPVGLKIPVKRIARPHRVRVRVVVRLYNYLAVL